MKRAHIAIAVAVALVLALAVSQAVKHRNPTESPTPATDTSTLDPKNATYDFGEGTAVTLVNGVATLKNDTDTATIRYADNEAMGDMDGDGKDDTAFIMTAEITTGAQISIIALVLASEGDAHHVLPFFLGDHIKLQSTAISDGTLTVSYLDHKDPADVDSPPTVQVTKYLKLKDGQFVELAPAVQ